jgi:hypothetical protein
MMMTDHDPRFDDAEAELRRGEAWRYREDGAPNPLTLKATGWSSGHTKHGQAEFLNGTDRDGKPWSVLVGSTVLRKRLIDGEVSEWDDERQAFVVTKTIGRVEVGEVVSLLYLGDKEGANGTSYATFKVSRRPEAYAADVTAEPVHADTPPPHTDDDIPF